MKRIFSILTLLIALPGVVFAAGGHAIQLEKANNSLADQDSLQRGAVLFSNYLWPVTQLSICVITVLHGILVGTMKPWSIKWPREPLSQLIMS
jgi:NADH:ubiquinone oxidoreductase subunit 6 (subunit J)